MQKVGTRPQRRRLEVPSLTRFSLAGPASPKARGPASGVLTMHKTGGLAASGEPDGRSRNQWWENRTAIDPSVEIRHALEFTRFYG